MSLAKLIAGATDSGKQDDDAFRRQWSAIWCDLRTTERKVLFVTVWYHRRPFRKDEEGNDKRPDCIIDLPDDKNLIIDSKVSLSAYEQYVNSEDELKKQVLLKQHLESIKKHIKDLAGKDYPNLNPFSLKMINRLSDYFFVLARFLNSKSPKEEIMWKR